MNRIPGRLMSALPPIWTALWALAFGAGAGPATSPAGETSASAPSWQRPYSGDEATGTHVVALWTFDAGMALQDASGKGHELKRRGSSRIVPDGRFGSCLECFAAVQDGPEGAMAAQLWPDLSPAGAFTLELWLRPKPEMAKASVVFLLDAQYYQKAGDPRANAGYMFQLHRRADQWCPVVVLGFGTETETCTGRPVTLAAGQWHHLAFTYDGAGAGRFLVDGRDAGGAVCAGRGSIAPAQFPLTIGGRYGSTHHGTPAYIDQVRITRGVTLGGLTIDIGTDDGRTVFRRLEKGIRLRVQVRNHTEQPLSQGRLHVAFDAEQTQPLPDLAPRTAQAIPVPLDLSRRPGTYTLRATATARATATGRRYEADQTTPIVIVPRPLPHTMPVVMWGTGDLPRLKQIGFTHHVLHLGEYRGLLETGKPLAPEEYPNLASHRERLNQHLAEGVGAAAYLGPGWAVMREPAFQRVDRAGRPVSGQSACVLAPDLQRFAYNAGFSLGRALGSFPALEGALINTEVRDHTTVCFHAHDQEAFQKLAGYPIPPAVTDKTCPGYRHRPDFPKDGVIPDNDPVLTYYRWFWQQGDGWNAFHTQAHQGLRDAAGDRLWTFHDPAVRVPSLWGSGGGVDYLSQWTYTYPDPIKIGQATDELLAMAEGSPHAWLGMTRRQQVMKMTQIIWYRSGTAPRLPADKASYAPWEKELPEARFITISPDHLREAFWSKISRPIQGIMYHGWESLVPTEKSGAYCFTHPRTAEVLKELIEKVVRPLGPLLVQVPDRPSDVAILESFASQVLAGRGTWGWGGTWEADVHLILQWAQVQPRIVYDETILRDGLAGVRVLVMPFCDVLTESVARRVQAFQRQGGLIVADEYLAPALTPNIRLRRYPRTQRAAEDKAALQALAADLRRQLDPHYERYGESDNPDVVVRFRRYGSADYLFAVNDKRTFGTYVGHHGLVMEDGVATRAKLRVRRPGAHVYDLVAHQAVAVSPVPGGIELAADFGPGGGRLFLLTGQKIADVLIESPAAARRGQRVPLRITVVDEARQPLAAVVPLELRVIDAQGQPAEGSGYYGAKDGALVIDLDVAPNDEPGAWTLRVTELASARTRAHRLTISP